MNKCLGCGVVLQDKEATKEGYTKDSNKQLCERCFRIRHYGEYKQVVKTNQDFLPILKEINASQALVMLVADLTQLPENFELFRKNLTNPFLLVLTKRDLLPFSLKEDRLLEHLETNLKPIDTMIISSKKNYQLDELLDKIRTYGSGKVYIVGYTNAGKSTLLNQILKHYYQSKIEITTSPLPSTTLSSLEIKLPDLTFIDTPGLLEDGSMVEKVDGESLKKIFPKKEIKPLTYQVKTPQWIQIDEFALIEANQNNITFFCSNQLRIERFYTQRMIPALFEPISLMVEAGQEVVILGLGFFKCGKKGNLTVWTYPGVKVFKRKSLI